MNKIQHSQASVGILVGVTDSDSNPAALLQVRAEHDSYSKACQVTTHGKLNDDEICLDEPHALTTALGRKLREEIGEVAAEMIEASSATIIDLDRTVNASGRLIVTQGVDLRDRSEAFQSLLVPGHDVGGFRLCTDPSAIEPLTPEFKVSGVTDGEIRMFPDEILAVKKLFESVFKISQD